MVAARAKVFQLIPADGSMIQSSILKEKARGQALSYATLYKYLNELDNMKLVEKLSSDSQNGAKTGRFRTGNCCY
jgi:Fe2+ or Zn2+ uptake regulation protein